MTSSRYQPLSGEDQTGLDVEPVSVSGLRKYRSRYILALFMVILGFAVGFSCGELLQDNSLLAKVTRLHSAQCTTPAVRREWRSMGIEERHDYITAVQCLMSTPSKLRPDGTLYEDFAYVHSRIGSYSHNAAAFLSWHRYLLHIYEKELQTVCGYTKALPYWDWSLDWEALEMSPIFSNTTGFGGDGDRSGANSVGNGYCVRGGPFSGFRPMYYGTDANPHCLSRGFIDGETEGRLSGTKVSPAAVEEILNAPDYESFVIGLEKGPHNQIPNTIRGDFLLFSAPNDPIFFLHHGQLDRLWWKWQSSQPWTRLTEYAGNASRDSTLRATTQDTLPMGGLALDVKVAQVMNTRSGLLCYQY